MDMEWLHQDNLRDSQRITVNSKISNMIWIQPISNNGQGEKGIYGWSIESKQIDSKVKSYGWRQKRFATKWTSTQSITGATDDSQDVQENVDDVQIEIECGEDVFLGRDRVLVFTAKHKLCIENQVDTKDESTQRGVDQINDFVLHANSQNAEKE